MDILDAIWLGLLQGLTEFLPVSSSGHLVILQHFLGIDEPQIFFDVMLHVGTLGSIIFVYFRDIRTIATVFLSSIFTADSYRHPVKKIKAASELKFLWLVILGTIPTVIIALIFKKWLKSAFDYPAVAASMLIVTGLLLQMPRLRKTETERALNSLDAVRIGIMQGVAIMPGISRSGSTISTALFTGISPKTAARYSFLLSIPAIIGATILELKDLTEIAIPIFTLLIGTLTAFLVGYFALRFLIGMLNRGKLHVFSYYCWGLGVIVLIEQIVR